MTQFSSQEGFARRSFILTGLAGIGCAAMSAPALADQALVDKARSTITSMLASDDFPNFHTMLAQAKGALIIPNLVKAGLIIGAEGGSGVLVVRDPAKGWSPPAFYTMGSGSVGLQAGVQDAEVVLLLMNDKGLNAMMKDQVKLGGDVSIAVGPVGAGVDIGTTTNLGADIYTFSRTRGLFGGVSLEGAVIAKRDDWNTAYYGNGANSQTIVIDRRFGNPGAQTLIAALPKS